MAAVFLFRYRSEHFLIVLIFAIVIVFLFPERAPGQCFSVGVTDFYDDFGEQSHDNRVVGFKVSTPFNNIQYQVSEPCIRRTYRKDFMTCEVLLTFPRLEVLWVRYTDARRSRLENNLSDNLARYGTDWRMVEGQTVFGLRLLGVNLRNTYVSSEGAIAHVAGQLQLTFISPEIVRRMARQDQSLSSSTLSLGIPTRATADQSLGVAQGFSAQAGRTTATQNLSLASKTMFGRGCLFVFVLLFLLLILIRCAKRFSSDRQSTAGRTTAASESYRYVQKTGLFTTTELNFFRVLELALCDQFRIFGKVRLEDIVGAAESNRRAQWAARGRIKSRHIDFVLCDAQSLEFVACIELDDPSHQRRAAIAADRFKTELFAEVGLPLIRFHVSKEHSAASIRSECRKRGILKDESAFSEKSVGLTRT